MPDCIIKEDLAFLLKYYSPVNLDTNLHDNFFEALFILSLRTLLALNGWSKNAALIKIHEFEYSFCFSSQVNSFR